jgi:hypothetical protein
MLEELLFTENTVHLRLTHEVTTFICEACYELSGAET